MCTMTYSNLTDTRTNTPQKSSRQGARVDHILLHHMAGTDAAGVVALMQSGKRQVSANYAIGRDGHAWGVVPEEERAWTSGSTTDGGRGAAWDRRSITFEIADEVAGDAHGWPISAASFEKVARMIADVATRYGIPIDREHVIGHRELWEKYRASYPTACPGGLNLDGIVARARAIQSGGGSAPAPTPTPQENPDMPVTIVDKATGHAFALAPQWVQHLGRPQDPQFFANVTTVNDEVQHLEHLDAAFMFQAMGVPVQYLDAVFLRKERPNGDWSMLTEVRDRLKALQDSLAAKK